MIMSIIERFDWDKVLAYKKLVDWENSQNLTRAALEVIAETMLEQVIMGYPISIHKETGLLAVVSEGRPNLIFYIEHKTNVV